MAEKFGGMVDSASAEMMESQSKNMAYKARLKDAREAKKGDDAIAQIRQEPNLEKRAKALAGFAEDNGPVQYPEMVSRGPQKAKQEVVSNCARNRWAAFKVLFGPDQMPFFDEFRGRYVDHGGTSINKSYPAEDIINALAALGMTGQDPDIVRRDLRNLAMGIVRNSHIDRMNRIIPQWDGKSRFKTKIIEMFQCFDTPLNQDFSQYFWLSLYCRSMFPGCVASMSLVLIGHQGTGKSLFGEKICKVLMDDSKAVPTPMNLAGDEKALLRAVTGKSVMVAVSETAGLLKSDMDSVKSFWARNSDSYDEKFEDTIEQLRQWIILMDGNRYNGIQRDETGNRRFYPMFAFQMPDINGKKQWRTHGDFCADFEGFEGDVLQIMAECREWLANNGGLDGYVAFHNRVSGQVKAFSDDERNADSGTVSDPNLEAFMVDVLLEATQDDFPTKPGDIPKSWWMIERAGERRTGMVITKRAFADAYSKISRGEKVNWQRAEVKIKHVSDRLKGEVKRDGKAGSVLFFPKWKDAQEFRDHLKSLYDFGDVAARSGGGESSSSDDAGMGGVQQSF